MKSKTSTQELSGPASLIAAMGMCLTMVAVVSFAVSSIAMLLG